MEIGKMKQDVDQVPSLRDSPKRYWLMVLLVTAMIVCYAHRGSLAVAAPFIAGDLGLSLTMVGGLLSAFFWTYSFMQLPAGWLVDRFGVRRAYAWGYGIWSLAFTFTGFSKSVTTLGLSRILLGIGQAVAFPASARAVSNWFQNRERGTVTAGYVAGVRAGTALIGSIGAYMLSNHNWRLLFLIGGIVSLLWLLPWLRFVGKWENTGRVQPGTAAADGGGLSFMGSLSQLRDRRVLGIFMGFFAYDYAWFVYFNWLPGYLVLERRFTSGEMAVYSSVPYLAMLVIILLSGALSDWFVRRGLPEIRVRRSMIVVGLAIGCLVVPAGLVESRMTAVWLLTTALCGLGIASPNTWTLTQAVCPGGQIGSVSGIQNFGGNLGGILAPWLTGYIAQSTESFALALGITGVILVGGILAYTFLVRSMRPAGGRSPELNLDTQ